MHQYHIIRINGIWLTVVFINRIFRVVYKYGIFNKSNSFSLNYFQQCTLPCYRMAVYKMKFTSTRRH